MAEKWRFTRDKVGARVEALAAACCGGFSIGGQGVLEEVKAMRRGRARRGNYLESLLLEIPSLCPATAFVLDFNWRFLSAWKFARIRPTLTRGRAIDLIRAPRDKPNVAPLA